MTLINTGSRPIQSLAFGAKLPKFKPAVVLTGSNGGLNLRSQFNVPRPNAEYLFDSNNAFVINTEKAAAWDAVWQQKMLGTAVKRPAVDFATQGVLGVILPENFGVASVDYDQKQERLVVKVARERFSMVSTGETPWYLAVVDKKYLTRPPIISNN